MFLLIGAVSQGAGFEVKMLLVYFACLFLMWCFLFFGTPEKDRSCVTHCYEIQIWKFKPQGGSSTKKSGKSKTHKYLTLTNSLTDRVSVQWSVFSLLHRDAVGYRSTVGSARRHRAGKTTETQNHGRLL